MSSLQMRAQDVDKLHIGKLFSVWVNRWHFQCVLIDNIRELVFFVLWYASTAFFNEGQYFPLEDASFHDPIVWVIGLTVIGRMTDGVFAYGEDAVDEKLVVCVVRQVEMHGVNHFDDLMPPVAPGRYRRALVGVCTSDEGIQQMVCADDSLLDGSDTHAHVVALYSAGLIQPWKEVVG